MDGWKWKETCEPMWYSKVKRIGCVSHEANLNVFFYLSSLSLMTCRVIEAVRQTAHFTNMWGEKNVRRKKTLVITAVKSGHSPRLQLLTL